MPINYEESVAKTMTTKEAAEALGCSVEYIRGGLEQGTLPIGSAVKFRRWSYHISREAVENYMKGIREGEKCLTGK